MTRETDMTTSKSPVSRRTALLGGLGATGGLVLASGGGESAQAVTGGLGLPANPKVLMFGDSYTEGVGAVPTTKGYAYLVGAPLGWTVTVDGKGGSGYCNPTTYGAGNYATRLAKVAVAAYDLIVIQGGTNDDKTVNGVPVYDSPTIKAAIQKAIDTVRARFPNAKILLFGPSNPYGSATVDRLRVNDLLVAAASANALPYVNPIAEKWFLPGDGASFANPDNSHPSNAGHAHLRSLFVRDAQVLG